MWKNFLEFAENYKSTLMKLGVGFLVLFMIIQYNVYGKRSGAHTLLIRMNDGIIQNVCVTHSSKILAEPDGRIYAEVKNRKIYIPDEWGYVVPRENFYIAIVMDKAPPTEIYEIDGSLADLILLNPEREGCRHLARTRRPIVS